MDLSPTRCGEKGFVVRTIRALHNYISMKRRSLVNVEGFAIVVVRARTRVGRVVVDQPLSLVRPFPSKRKRKITSFLGTTGVS